MMHSYITFELIRNNTHVRIEPISQLISALVFISLAGCSSTSEQSNTTSSASFKSGGGYYLDDGPGENPPTNLDSIPDAIPRIEPLRKANMRPYIALGKSYNPMTTLGAYKKRGIASWYGRRYHGKQTASGEPYDMYGMTAAHTTLPLPSYARVTNIRNRKSIVVRINDRGPFLSNRLIDLSYTAAHKLGVLADGRTQVEVESILPGTNTTPQTTLKPLVSPPSTTTNTNVSEIYLQLGAFGSVGNAHNFLSHLQAELPWLSNSLNIAEKNGLFKIQAGPYPNQLLAQQDADNITQQLSIKPLLLID
tara:strand:+ start:2405 stop:3325 length:921 start_codon:yes stop_codon:yes gene_type:complete